MNLNLNLNRFKAINVIGLVVVLTGTIIFYIVMNSFNTSFYYDSGQYWNLSYSFVSDSGFSFLSYPYALRGYVFPFIIMIARNTFSIFGATDVQSYMLFFSLFYSCSIYFISTNFCQYCFNKRANVKLIPIIYIC